MKAQQIPVTPVTDTLAATVAVLDGRDLQARYDQAVALVMRMGSWLSSPQAQLLSSAEWEAQFALYRERLDALRTVVEELRPRGTVEIEGGWVERRACSDCDGSGIDHCILGNPCPCCGGRGETEEVYLGDPGDEAESLEWFAA